MSVISRSRRRTSCWMISSQPLARRLVLGQRQCLDRASQRGQRVLQFVADIGGEALDRLDAGIERVRHVAQRLRQIADLVLAVGEVGDLTRGS